MRVVSGKRIISASSLVFTLFRVPQALKGASVEGWGEGVLPPWKKEAGGKGGRESAAGGTQGSTWCASHGLGFLPPPPFAFFLIAGAFGPTALCALANFPIAHIVFAKANLRFDLVCLAWA